MYKGLLTIILVIAAISSIVYCFRYFSQGNLTTNEQVLFSILLTLASFFLSWLTSHFYYEVSNQEKIEEIKKSSQSDLKIYATKAAEKVTNLSTELTKLANYLKEEFEDNDYNTDQENLSAKKERMYSALHIINVLKSINDGSLSDWNGIIPDKIEDIKEEERAKVQSINTILDQYQNVVRDTEDEIGYGFRNDGLQDDIRQLNNKLDLAISNVAGVLIKPKTSLIKKEKIEKNCPKCNALIKYKQRPLLSSRKFVSCEFCKAKLDARWGFEDGFSLTVSGLELDSSELPSRETGIFKLDEDFIEIVKNKLPSQPWPKRIDYSLSTELSAPVRKVKEAIAILIDRGIFKHQINGILYEPVLQDSTNEKPKTE